MTRMLISAGEPSGDAYAARVVAALRQAEPGLEIEGVGGARMAAAPVPLLGRIEELSASGLVEAARHAGAHWRLLRALVARIRARRYELVVLVDYPGFHLRVARAAAGAGIPVLYYIAPQLWAWGGWRVHRLRRSVRSLAVVLPFEERFFARRGIPAVFVGHPLLDQPAPPTRRAARDALGVPATAPLLALLPGSRPHEVARHWPLFRDAARCLRRELPGLEVVAAGEMPGHPSTTDAASWRGDPAIVLAAADAALCKAGTTTLEAALAGVPMVIAHRVHPATYAAARALVRVHQIGLVNLLAGAPLVPELVQRGATPHTIARALRPLLDADRPAARTQRAGFATVRESLGSPGAAQRVADLALQLVA